MQWWPWCLKIVINLRADQWKFLSYHLRKKHPWKLWPLGKHDEGSILGMWKITASVEPVGMDFFSTFFWSRLKLRFFIPSDWRIFSRGSNPAISRSWEKRLCHRRSTSPWRTCSPLWRLAVRWSRVKTCHDAHGNFRIKKVDVGISTSSTHSDFMVISCCFLLFIFVYIYLCQSKLTDIFPFRLEA